MARFSELISAQRRPPGSQTARRRLVDASPPPPIGNDPANNGFVSGLATEAGTRLNATRRTFLRGSVLTAAASAAAATVQLFGPARRVEAQTGGIVGPYPRRIAQYCPPLNANDNCQPGCGSSPVCTDCCTSDGYFRNDPANGYTLYTGNCGGVADGWIWRFQGACGNCSTITYRCSDGYVQTDTGPVPFICRAVVDCEPLADGQQGTSGDAARPTNWRPAGALEFASDNGGSVTLQGWINDGTGTPVDLRITADGAIVHLGRANQVHRDGSNTGFRASFASRPGTTRYCVDALSGLLSATIACVDLAVGSSQSVRQDPPPASAPAAAPDAPSEQAEPTPTPPPERTVSAVVLDLPEPGDPSDQPTIGAVTVLRRVDEASGFVSGWAGDLDNDLPALVRITVDDEVATTVRCDLPRPDVTEAFPGMRSDAGFATSFDLPESRATVCVEVIGTDDGLARPLGCRTIGRAIRPERDDEAMLVPGEPNGELPDPVAFGSVDDFVIDGRMISAGGWAYNPGDRSDAVEVRLLVDGTELVAATTDLPHARAEERYGVNAPGFDLRAEVEPGPRNVVVVATLDDVDTVLGEKSFLVP